METTLEQRIINRQKVLKEKQEKRLKAYENRLLREYDKAWKEKNYMKMKLKSYWLQRNFGYDADYVVGSDDGEVLEVKY